ncbi:MAG: polysaccharide biosynthesis tyrosine autokinase [Rhizonema sp. NSF051]|nr:polysaccharide biosynthesis tyrosine autokinase [Rhizonema sp. NSF051]
MPSHQEERDSIDFQQYWLILKKRWLLIAVVMGSVIGLTGLITFKQKPIYEAQGKLLFNKQNGVSSLTGLSEQIGQLSGLTTLSNPLDTEAEVIRSNAIVQKTIVHFQLKDKTGKPLTIDAFLQQLKLRSIRDTDVMALSYRSTNPYQATAVINFLMADYLENNIRINRASARAAREFLSRQLPNVEKRVVAAEAALRGFKEENNVVALGEEAKIGVERLSELSNHITEAQAALADVKSRSLALQSQLKSNTQQAVALNTLSQSYGVQQVLSEYQKVQDQLTVEHSRFQNEHPTIVNLMSKEQALKEQLKRRVAKTLNSNQIVPEQNLQIGELKQTLTANLVQSDIERLGLGNQIGVLTKKYSLFHARLRDIPRLQQRQQQLERQLQVAGATYEEMLKRLQEVQVVENQNVGNARVVSEALVPKKPISPPLALHLALGGFLGILLAVGTVLMLESVDKSVKTVEEASKLLRYPLLGTIPLYTQKSTESSEQNLELPVLNNLFSPVNAAFEMLVANLGFTVSDKTLKVIVVTSAIPSEGKSYVAANLAVATAQMGRRVLLVDADMRHPRQQQIWKLPNIMGLSNVLVAQTELQTTAQEAVNNVEVLTSGTIPPNPAALLDSQRMASLITEATREYNFVIIDTAPLSIFADAMILGKLADGILLVVRSGVVKSTTATATKTLLEQSQQRVLGMVMNGEIGGSMYGYYFSYYYEKNNSATTGRNKSKLLMK